MRALIADDEANLGEFLATRLHALWPQLDILPIAHNGYEALEGAQTLRPDVVFLDIKMPGLSGLDVAARLADANCHVVFVTAYDQFAIQAFEHHAVDYLLKPVKDERLERTIARLKKADRASIPSSEQMSALFARMSQAVAGQPQRQYLRWVRVATGELVKHVPLDEVVFFKAADKYTIVGLLEDASHGELLIRLSLTELLEQLDPDLFWQVHRGTIVNLTHVLATRRDLLGKTYIRLRGQKSELAVSRQYVHRFRQM